MCRKELSFPLTLTLSPIGEREYPANILPQSFKTHCNYFALVRAFSATYAGWEGGVGGGQG